MTLDSTGSPKLQYRVTTRWKSIPGKTKSSKFPADIELTGLGPLSDALVGRKSWGSKVVQEERNTILGESGQARDYYESWKNVAKKAFVAALTELQTVEQDLFQEGSYYRWRDTHIIGELPVHDIDPQPEYDGLVRVVDAACNLVFSLSISHEPLPRYPRFSYLSFHTESCRTTSWEGN